MKNTDLDKAKREMVSVCRGGVEISSEGGTEAEKERNVIIRPPKNKTRRERLSDAKNPRARRRLACRVWVDGRKTTQGKADRLRPGGAKERRI